MSELIILDPKRAAYWDMTLDGTVIVTFADRPYTLAIKHASMIVDGLTGLLARREQMLERDNAIQTSAG